MEKLLYAAYEIRNCEHCKNIARDGDDDVRRLISLSLGS